MPKFLMLFVLLFSLSIVTSCASYSVSKSPTHPEYRSNKTTLSYIINCDSPDLKESIKSVFESSANKFNYTSKYYIGDGVLPGSSYLERYSKIADPYLIYPQEKVKVCIYFGTSDEISVINRIYRIISMCTLFIIPYIGSDDEVLTIDMTVDNKFVKRYRYVASYSMFVQILLFPAMFTNSEKEKQTHAFELMIEQFICDAQKDNLL
jgi:hypothetical protein